MSDKTQPESLVDSDLDTAEGGLILNLSVGVKADRPVQGPRSMDASEDEFMLDQPGLTGKRDIGTGA